MANNTIVLEEFLTRLGYQVDENSFRKFMSAIGASDSGMANLAVSAGSATLAITTMVNRVAERIEKLYYVAQASGESINSLQGIGYAADMIGIGAEKAQAKISGLAMAIKTNPGLQGLLIALGVNPSQRPGDVFSGLIHRLQSMPFFIASQYAQQFGISPDELIQFENNIDKYDAAQRRYAEIQRQFGVNNDANAGGFVRFRNTVEDIIAKIEAIGEKIASDFLAPAQKVLDWTDEAITKFGELNKETNSWLGLLTTIGTAIGGGLLGKSLLGRLFGGGAAAAAGSAIGGAGEAAVAGGIGYAAGVRLFRLLGLSAEAAGALAAIYYGGGFNQQTAQPEQDEINPKTDKPYGIVSTDLPRGLRNNNPGNVRLKEGYGEHDKDGFSVFSTPGVGIGVMTNQLRRFASIYGLNTLDDIIRRWTKGDKPEIQDSYIKTAEGITGFGHDQKLNLEDPQTLLKLEKAIIRVENGYNPYEDRVLSTYIGNQMSEFDSSGKSITINDNSTLNVNGNAQPDQVAKAVEDVKKRSYEDLARHFTPRNKQ